MPDFPSIDVIICAHDMARLPQRLAEIRGRLPVVLDDQNPHRINSPCPMLLCQIGMAK